MTPIGLPKKFSLGHEQDLPSPSRELFTRDAVVESPSLSPSPSTPTPARKLLRPLTQLSFLWPHFGPYPTKVALSGYSCIAELNIFTGSVLREATEKGVIHVARHYHHETVRVRGRFDDVRDNVRKGLDVTTATNYRQNRSRLTPSASTADLSRTGRSSSIAGAKRSSHETGAPLPPSKRPCSTSPTKAGSDALPNRVHRRVVLSDYGIPIYEASSREALLAALADCIEGHESLRQKAGLLHRDISIGNLMISKDSGGFLIDLDLAVREQRVGASGAKGKTGTRAFMAIGALLGEQHSFMHDLESFFWVLFWICIHYDGPGEGKVVAQFDKWNFADTEELAKLKLGTVLDEDIFHKTMEEFFTEYYQPLLPWVNKLRKAVFPDSGRWKREDSGLYTQMREILEEAQKTLAEGPEL